MHAETFRPGMLGHGGWIARRCAVSRDRCAVGAVNVSSETTCVKAAACCRHLGVRTAGRGRGGCTPRMNDLSERYRRSSLGLKQWLPAVATELGGRAGERLCRKLHSAADRSRLLELLEAPPVPERAPRVLRGDEFAFRRERRYAPSWSTSRPAAPSTSGLRCCGSPRAPARPSRARPPSLRPDGPNGPLSQG